MININDKINDLIISKKIYFYAFLLLVAGIALMYLSKKNLVNSSYKNKIDVTSDKENIELKFQNNNNELKLKSILSKTEGVGNVEIIINYVSDYEQQIETDDKLFDTGSATFSTEKSKNTKEVYSIEGVIIVAEGAQDDKIVFDIREAVSSFLGVPIHKISVLNMK